MIHRLNKKTIIELIIIFITTLLFNLLCVNLNGDEIWNYGFTYNISKGLIPYKDFNMITTPLFPMLGALFLKLFGTNIVIFHAYNALICTVIFYYMKKQSQRSYYITYIILLSNSIPNYNILCILLLYILMNIDKKEHNDYLIGFLLGITFLTKQNIGIYLCIPTLFTKSIKKITKRIIGFLIPTTIIIIYLTYNNCLYEFIDYAFLGLFSFAKQNTIISPVIILLVISILYLIYKYIKTKDITIIYLLCFHLSALPIIESYHTMIAIIPTLGYFLSTLNLNKKIITFAFIVSLLLIFSYNIYNIFNENINYPNKTNTFTYRKIFPYYETKLEVVSNYIKNIDTPLFIISKSSYAYKIETQKEINKYDLLINGNLGYNGSNKIIKEIEDICNKEECTFIIEHEEQELKENTIFDYKIIQYIEKNYDIDSTIYDLTIYKN